MMMLSTLVDTGGIMARIRSRSPTKWLYWMVLDVLGSKDVKINYAFVYYDKKKEEIVARKAKVPQYRESDFIRFSACTYPTEGMIFIDYDAENKPVCLLHECLELILCYWNDRYFVPERWGIAHRQRPDPFDDFEKVSWRRLTPTQKKKIASYLPKR